MFSLSIFSLSSLILIGSSVMCLAGHAEQRPSPPPQPSASKTESVIANRLAIAPGGSVHLAGWLSEAMAACRARGFSQSQIDEFVTPFAARSEVKTWQSEFWGKWMSGIALANRVEPDPKLRSLMDDGFSALMKTQGDDGSFTTYKKEAEFTDWDTWGRKYTLLGLVAYFDSTGNPAALQAARQHADAILAHFGPNKATIATNGLWQGMAAGSILEPMVLLASRTGDSRYLEFAQYIVRSWSDANGPALVDKALLQQSVYDMFPGPDPKKKGYMSGGSSKAYEMMSCFEGLLELFRVTQNPAFLQAAKNVHRDILNTEITLVGSGSIWERWAQGRSRQHEPIENWMETCVTVTWLRLSAQLLQITGDPTYADVIERASYNALLGAQNETGSWWAHYSPLQGSRKLSPEQCGLHTSCCVANGPRGLFMLPAIAFMTNKTGPVINFYEASSAEVSFISGTKIRLQIASVYPNAGDIVITVLPEETREFSISLRIPGWSSNTEIEVNGHAVSGVTQGNYFEIKRTWKEGDRIRLKLAHKVRITRDPSGSGLIALERGPIVFVLDSRYMSGLHGIGKIEQEADGEVRALDVPQSAMPSGIQAAIDVPFLCANSDRQHLRFVDYASGGNTWSDRSTIRVWFRPELNLAHSLATPNVP